jgi:hypothetical protein
MIHIGPVKFDGSDAPQTQAKPAGRERKQPLPRSGTQNGLVLVNLPRKAADSAKSPPPQPDFIRGVSPVRLRPRSDSPPAPERSVLPSGKARLVARFLTWCFPVRDFSSPMQRILYLSMEGPRVNRRKRLVLR